MAMATLGCYENAHTAFLEEDADPYKLLQEFSNFSSIEKAWIVKSDDENSFQAICSFGQTSLPENRKRTLILFSHISKKNATDVTFCWSQFPMEMLNVSAIVPSPSGKKFLVVRNNEKGPITMLEIWGPSHLEQEIRVPDSVHGSVYTDRWFEGISWSCGEVLIAYVAEEPHPCKPVFDNSGCWAESSFVDHDVKWKGQGDWEEDWGETYTGKRKPSLFVLDVNRGIVRPVGGIAKSLSAGQVVWAPSASSTFPEYLVFVGWSSQIGPQNASRKLGMKVCYSRPCALYAVRSPFQESEAELQFSEQAINLTPSISSAFFPRFSPDGQFLVFQSAQHAVDTGAHEVTKSFHRLDWTYDFDKKLLQRKFFDVVSVVPFAENGCFPGLYNDSLLPDPWLSDGCTIVMSSAWGSTQVLLSINILSGNVSRISPVNLEYSWNILALSGDNILASYSSLVDPPQIKYGYQSFLAHQSNSWEWLDIDTPVARQDEMVRSLLSSYTFTILKIPVEGPSEKLATGANKTFEAILLSSQDKNQNHQMHDPMIVFVHGGPHSVTLTSYSKRIAFLIALGYNILIVNYRGSIGFGEDALQSLPGNIGFQDVNDVLAAINFVIKNGLANPSKVGLCGSSYGGFLAAHLIGEAADRFAAAVLLNPVCNLALMAGTSDIPDWCYALTFGKDSNRGFSGSPSIEQLRQFYRISPIAYVSKVKAPVLFLLGEKDRRVPFFDGLQYSRALNERGVETKVIVFKEDGHVNFRPQSEFESLLNMALWFEKHCK